jgi:hypothetical protein
MYEAPRNPEPAKQLLAFLNNHHETIEALDFVSVPMLNLWPVELDPQACS